MAHNLNFNEQTGQYSFFSVQKKAWHGLGQIVSEYPTSADAIRYAGLDYEVVKSPLFANPPAQNEINAEFSAPRIEVPDYFATIRTDNNTVLGVVGNDYEVVQNKDAFSFFDEIVGGGDGIQYETAGALGNGESIFITAKLPGYIRVGNGDDVTEKYIFLTTTHDGTGSITAAFTPVRIVCQNTLNAALRNMSNVIRLRHTTGVTNRFAEAHKIMGIANSLTDELEGIFNQWAKVRITDPQVKRLIQMALCPNKETMEFIKNADEDSMSAVFKNACNDAFAYAMTCETQLMDTTKGTLFGAYNAVTGYFQNVKKFNDEEAKLNSIVLGGTANKRTQSAFDLCSYFEKEGAAALMLS